MFFDGKAVGHPCDVITDCTFETTFVDKILGMPRQHQRFGTITVEQVGYKAFRLDLHSYDAVVTLQILVEKILELAVSSLHLLAIPNDIVFESLHIKR